MFVLRSSVSVAVLAAIVSGLVGSSAMADDNRWTGAYVGINGGYGWTTYKDQLADQTNGAGNLFNGLSPKGFIGGGQIGLNQQLGRVVVGVEADLSGGRISDSATWGTTFTANSTSRLERLSTYRLRAGYTFDNVLVYGTAGFAMGNVTNTVVFSTGAAYGAKDVSSGTAFGGGFEYKFAPQWSLKTEYLRVNLGKTDPLLSGTGRTYSSFAGTTVRNDEYNIVRLGLNYSFNFDRPAAAPMK